MPQGIPVEWFLPRTQPAGYLPADFSVELGKFIIIIIIITVILEKGTR